MPPGKGFAGSGTIVDPVNCQGTIAVTSGGTINLLGGVTVAGTGVVNLGNGSLTTNDSLSGISGGGLFTANHYVGSSGAGSFSQSGGSNTVSGNLYLGNNAGDSGAYLLSGSGLLSVGFTECVGNSGSGNFTQTGGTHSAASFNVGDNAGSSGLYTLNGGLLSSAYQTIGSSGGGTLTQSGGNNPTTFLTIGDNAGSIGVYNLGGSGHLSAWLPHIGTSGTATFNQTGGTNTVTGTLYLADNAGSSGTYNLSGGLLLLSSLVEGAGTAAFNIGGGTLQAGAAFSTSLPMTLGTSGGGATFDTAGHVVTLSGSLSGPGSLTLNDSLGTGTLILSASNSYTRDTIVNHGTLTIDYPCLAAGSNAWVDNSGLGGTLDLNYSGTDSINAFYVDGVAQEPGVWGGPGSGAPNTSPYLGGSGLLDVAVPEPSALLLLVAAALGLLGYTWRRRRRDARQMG